MAQAAWALTPAHLSPASASSVARPMRRSALRHKPESARVLGRAFCSARASRR